MCVSVLDMDMECLVAGRRDSHNYYYYHIGYRGQGKSMVWHDMYGLALNGVHGLSAYDMGFTYLLTLTI